MKRKSSERLASRRRERTNSRHSSTANLTKTLARLPLQVGSKIRTSLNMKMARIGSQKRKTLEGSVITKKSRERRGHSHT